MFTQTRTYLGPDEVLKGLQGEIEEVLNGISLSVSVLKGLYRTYQFCCANMKLFFKVRRPRSDPEPAVGSGRVAQVGAGEGGRQAQPLSLPLFPLPAPTQDKEPVPWEFPSSLAFSRMNSFFRRIQTIEVKVKPGSALPARQGGPHLRTGVSPPPPIHVTGTPSSRASRLPPGAVS